MRNIFLNSMILTAIAIFASCGRKVDTDGDIAMAVLTALPEQCVFENVIKVHGGIEAAEHAELSA